jgi:hypothetical protein
MTFKSYCYEMWLQYMEECMVWNDPKTLPYPRWVVERRWMLKRMYRSTFGNLQKPWQSEVDKLIQIV